MLKIDYQEVSYNNVLVLKANQLQFDLGVTVLVGENGAGKSTILNLLYRELMGHEPIVTLDNDEVSNLPISDYRNSIVTYVSQENKLFPLQTVSESIDIIVGEDNFEKLNRLVEILQLEDVIKRNPKTHKLSGGEQQKVKLLCGLLSSLPVLLLDEPFNNLDSTSIAKLNEYIKTENKYLIVTSHIDFVEDYKTYEIIDNNLISCKAENYDQKFALKPEKQLIRKQLKSLRKNNIKIRYPLYVLNLVIVLTFLLAVVTTVRIYRIAAVDLSNFVYGDTTTTIKPPIQNSYFLTFGDESWLDTTKAYFDDEDIERLESLDYVKAVVPIKASGYGMGEISYKNKYILDVDLDNDQTNYTFSTALYSGEIAKNLPSQIYTVNNESIDEFEVGTFPEDNSNQAMLDTVAADYVLEHTAYDSYDQLVGETLAVPVVTREGNDRSTINFVISGVFKPFKSKADSTVSGTIVPAFELSSRMVQSTYTQFQSRDELYARVQESLEIVGLDPNLVTPDDIQTPAYDSLYIETNRPEDVERLTNQILDYDQFIEVENNYLYSQTINFKYLRKIIVRNVVIMGVILVIFVGVLRTLFSLYKNKIDLTVKTLEFYAYNQIEIANFIKFEQKEYLITVLIINLLMSILILVGKYKIYSLTALFAINIILFIINYAVLKITFKTKGSTPSN